MSSNKNKNAVKALKKALANDKQKAPSASKNPSKRVGKNLVRQMAAGMSAEEKKAKKDILKVFHAITDPLNADPVRLGAVYGSAKTAVAKPWQRINASFNNSPSGGVTNCIGMAFSDPYCNLIRNATVFTATIYKLQPYPIIGPANGGAGLPGDIVPLPVPGLTFLTGNNVHGPKLYPARLTGQKDNFYYAQTSDVLTVTTSGGGAMTYVLYLYRYWQNTFTQIATGNVTGVGPSTFAYTVPSATQGYYCWRIQNNYSSNAGPASLNITVEISLALTGSNAYWGHLAMPYIGGNAEAADGIKVIGTSLMYTNVAPQIYREGKVAALQVPAGEWPFNYIDYSFVANNNDAVSMEITNGCYIFKKMQQASDLFFKNFDSDTIGATLETNAWWPLERTSDFVVISCFVSNAQGQDGYWTIANMIEYRTTDVWRDTEYASIRPDVVDEAIMLVGKCPQVHENSFHVSDLWDYFKSAVNGVYNTAKDIIPVVGKVAHVAGLIASAL
jgi:hypothetical protein